MTSFRKYAARTAALFSMLLPACAVDVDESDIPESDEIATQVAELAIRSGNLWRPGSNGITTIPVCFIKDNAARRTKIQSVVEASWEAIRTTAAAGARGGVDFTGWGSCAAAPSTPMIRIDFDDARNNEVVGGLGRDMEGMNLRTTATDDTIMHEFGHALGFTHEFRRKDYAAYDPACTETDGTAPDIGLLGPDKFSIMNYVSCGRSGVLTTADKYGFTYIYGPSPLAYNVKIAIRQDLTWTYVLATTTAAGIGTTRIDTINEFTLEWVSGPNNTFVNAQDMVRIRTRDGRYLRSDGNNTQIYPSTIKDARSAFRIEGPSVAGYLYVNDRVKFKTFDGQSLIGSSADNKLYSRAFSNDFRIFRLGYDIRFF